MNATAPRIVLIHAVTVAIEPVNAAFDGPVLTSPGAAVDKIRRALG